MKATAKVAKEPTRETEQSKAVAAKKMSIVMISGPESQNFFHEERIDDVVSFFFSEEAEIRTLALHWSQWKRALH